MVHSSFLCLQQGHNPHFGQSLAKIVIIMYIERLREYCLSLPHVLESFPFNETTLVFKVGGKIFALIGLEHSPGYICLKCDPDEAIRLREHYTAVEGAYHMNKTHWNGITLGRDMPLEEVKEWVKHSYDLVYSRLSKQARQALIDNTTTQ